MNLLIDDLSRALSGAGSQIDFRMQIGSFAVLADFLFDGIFADAYMCVKIINSLQSARELKMELLGLRKRLEGARFISGAESLEK